ncbi:hypothetical protein PCASD_05297 [Puccinia coronata f. sp. avenae]|uniref:Uncharacterized protein n=1 Tax=Puccinia coronata f. sp. avenae TaxID=200324 RepID=A0A2N5UXT0_9BASI|nr:hypothetical protein PCASD_05297 [Puccinia coronata f. sp. avenae]
MYPLSSSSSAAAGDSSSSSSSSWSPNHSPNYIDRNTIANLLQPHLVLLSLQDSRLSLSQPIILSTSCYHSINQIIDQVIYSILISISSATEEEQSVELEVVLPIELDDLTSHGIYQVLRPALAQRSIQAAELGWMVYQNKLNSSQLNQPFSADYSPVNQQQQQQQQKHATAPLLHHEQTSTTILLSDLFLQLQIDCQILSPYNNTHQPWLKANTGHLHKSNHHRHQTHQTQENPLLNQPSVELFNQSLDLLVNPYYFDTLLESYHTLYKTVNLPLRQQQQQPNQQDSRGARTPKPQSTILQDRLMIYFLGVIQAFTNYLLEVIISIVQTRLPYPSAIQAHHLIGFMAQDDQIIDFLTIMETIQAKASLFPHSPLSPFCLVESSTSHHEKSATLKPLMLTPTMINKLGPASHSLNQIPQSAHAASGFTPLHSPFLPVSPRARLQTASLGNRGTVSGARLEKVMMASDGHTTTTTTAFQSFHHPHQFSSTPPAPSSTHRRLVSHRSLNSLPTRASTTAAHLDYPSPDLSLHPLPSAGPHSLLTYNPAASSALSPSHLLSSFHSPPPPEDPTAEHQATYRSVTIKRVPPKSKGRKQHPVQHAGTPTVAPPIASPAESQVLQRPPPAPVDTARAFAGHYGNHRSQKTVPQIIGFPTSTSEPSHRLGSIPYRPTLSTSSSSSIPSLRSSRTTPLTTPSADPSQMSKNDPKMRQPSDLVPSHQRSKSMTVTTSPLLGQPAPSSSSHVTAMDSNPKSLKSHKKGHSIAQPPGLGQRISFEQLMRSNETVKFSLTPGPCLDSVESPVSRHSSDSLSCSPDKSEQILIDPTEMISPKSKASKQLLPRSELLPRTRYQSQSFADTPPQLPELNKFEDQILSPSSNMSSLRSIHSEHNLGPLSSMSSKRRLPNNLSSMSQRIAASRTSDPSISDDLPKRQTQLQSLTEILNSDPPWLTGPIPKSRKSSSKTSQSSDQPNVIGALGLSTPHPVRSQVSQATSIATDFFKSHRYTQATSSSDGINAISQPQSAEHNQIPSGLQKKLRGFKSMISRRIKIKEEPHHPLPSTSAVKPHQSSAPELDPRSASSVSESRDLLNLTQPRIPPLENEEDPSNENPSSLKAEKQRAPTSSQARHSEESGTAPKNLPSKGMTSSPDRPAAQPGLTESIIASKAASASENRSRLRRSISLSSHLRRQQARDSEADGVFAQPLRRARSRGSKSRTVTENSNSSGLSRGTITDERGFRKTIAGEPEGRSDLDDIMALASRLNRRFRGSFDPRRPGSLDSLSLVQPDLASKQRRDRQETGSSVEDNFEISFAQELKPTMVNRIVFTSPTKKPIEATRTIYRSSDENILLSYYDSSSQSTAIDDEGSNFKEQLFDNQHERRSQKSSRGGAEGEEEEARGSRDHHSLLGEEGHGSSNSSSEDRDEYISLEGLKQMVLKLNAVVDQLSKPPPPDQRGNDDTVTAGLGIKRVDLLKMMID